MRPHIIIICTILLIGCAGLTLSQKAESVHPSGTYYMLYSSYALRLDFDPDSVRSRMVDYPDLAANSGEGTKEPNRYHELHGNDSVRRERYHVRIWSQRQIDSARALPQIDKMSEADLGQYVAALDVYTQQIDSLLQLRLRYPDGELDCTYGMLYREDSFDAARNLAFETGYCPLFEQGTLKKFFDARHVRPKIYEKL